MSVNRKKIVVSMQPKFYALERMKNGVSIKIEVE